MSRAVVKWAKWAARSSSPSGRCAVSVPTWERPPDHLSPRAALSMAFHIVIIARVTTHLAGADSAFGAGPIPVPISRFIRNCYCFAQMNSASVLRRAANRSTTCPASTIFAGWRQSVLPVHLLGLAPLLGSVGPVAGDVKLQDDGVVHDPVNRRGGGHGVGKDALPLREDQV